MKSRIAFTFIFAAFTFIPRPISAIPNVFINGQLIGPIVPAHPRFGADLTKEFLAAGVWEEGEFSGPWSDLKNDSRHMTAMPVVFGAVPESIVAHQNQSGKTQEIEITYLNAGTFFGYKFEGEKTHSDREIGSEKRSQFAHQFGLISKNLRDRLDTGCGPGEQVVMGRSDLLRSVLTDYQYENFTIRLARRDNHSVALHLMPTDARTKSLVAADFESLDKKERQARFSERVTTEANSRGDTQINGIPMFKQGTTPFCGIHTLAMASDYYGLNLGPDELAAAADFKNTGSARGSNILELYHAAFEELGMRVKVSSRFDFERAQKALAAGMPVIVWRRVSIPREEAHAKFVSQLAVLPNLSLPKPTRSDQEKWPERSKKGSPSHASILTGFNAERDEIIFTDPWGESARNKRMRSEEMEATAYTVFYFEL